MTREYPEQHYRAFAVGYHRMLECWNMTSSGTSVLSTYEIAKNRLGMDSYPADKYETRVECESFYLGQIVALLHLNGVEP